MDILNAVTDHDRGRSDTSQGRCLYRCTVRVHLDCGDLHQEGVQVPKSHHLVNAQRLECVRAHVRTSACARATCRAHTQCVYCSIDICSKANTVCGFLSIEVNNFNFNQCEWLVFLCPIDSFHAVPQGILQSKPHMATAVSVLISKRICLTARPDRCAD